MSTIRDGRWMFSYDVEPDGNRVRVTVFDGDEVVASPTFPRRTWATFALATVNQILRRFP